MNQNKQLCFLRLNNLHMVIAFCLLLISFSCCVTSTTKKEGRAEVKAATFSLPEIPMMMTSPEQRAEYLAAHYWDNFDFADTTLIDNQQVTEQAFADYISILPHTTTANIRSSISATLDSALSGSQAMYDHFADLFDRYLDYPNSPARNEELYILVLEGQINNEKLDDIYRIRPKSRLDMALKNRNGDKATNFEYTLASGNKQYMHGITADYLILFFNNPDCHDCARVKEILSQISDKKVHILAIYADEDINLWKKSEYPTDWINGYSETIRAKQLYDLRAIPNLYLLDKNKRVILKDVQVEAIIQYLNQNN